MKDHFMHDSSTDKQLASHCENKKKSSTSQFRTRYSLCFSATLFSLIIGCGPIYNTSYSDEEKYGKALVGTEAYRAAQAVIINKCAGCHGAWAGWLEADYITNRKVERRSPINSILYTRVNGNDTEIAGDMPPSGPITNEEVITIRNWILGM